MVSGILPTKAGGRLADGCAHDLLSACPAGLFGKKRTTYHSSEQNLSQV